MARVRGQDVTVLMGDESTYGVLATGNWRRLPVRSIDLGGALSLVDDPIISAGLGREHADPYLDVPQVQGNVVVPVDVRNFGYWLKMLFGPATVTGSANPYLHSFAVTGPQVALPSRSIEKGFNGAAGYNKFHVALGVKANSLDLTWTNTAEQAPTATIGLIGRQEVQATSSSGGTPTTQAYTRFLQKTASVTWAGSGIVDVMSVNLRYSNGLEVVRTVNAGGLADNVDEGQIDCTGEIRVRHNDATLLNAATGNTPATIAATWAYDSNWSLGFQVARAFLGKPSVGVSGPGGIEVTYPFRAAFSSSVGNTLVVYLQSPVSGY
jgi:hypothetical protein